MGDFAIGTWMRIGAWVSASIIVILNAKLVVDQISEWLASPSYSLLIWLLVVPVAVASGLLLLYITFQPLATKLLGKAAPLAPRSVTYAPQDKPAYRRIAITVDFSRSDANVIDSALAIGKTNAEYVLIHIVETAGAHLMGNEI